MSKIDLNLDYSAIIDRLNKAKSGFKNIEWAKKIGVKPNVITNIHGKTRQNPSMEYIIAVSKVTCRPIEYYLWGTSLSNDKDREYSSAKDQIIKKNLHDLTDNDKARISDIAKSSETDKLEKPERIRFVRNQLNLTQDDFGNPIGLKQANVRDLEAGKVNISTLHALAIENIYGISSEWLLTGEGEMFVQSSQQEAKSYEQKIDKEKEAEKLLEEAKKVLKSDDKDLVEGLKFHIKTAIRMMKMEKELHANEKKKDE